LHVAITSSLQLITLIVHPPLSHFIIRSLTAISHLTALDKFLFLCLGRLQTLFFRVNAQHKSQSGDFFFIKKAFKFFICSTIFSLFPFRKKKTASGKSPEKNAAKFLIYVYNDDNKYSSHPFSATADPGRAPSMPRQSSRPPNAA
jgi:hypothetical protein